MVGSLLKRGLANVRIFLPEEEKSVDCTNPQGWTWKTQQDWPCSCKDGDVQAPLKLLSGESKKQSKIRLTWNYHDVTSPQAVFNGHEVEIRGSFGSFSLHHPNSKKDYFANKITFKFPSEHHIDSNLYEGEMLIHHESGGVIFNNEIKEKFDLYSFKSEI
jgi:carbonic anhydrase